MAITKHIRRAHAYTGLTFSTARSFGRGRQDVILSGGRVTEDKPFGAPFEIDIDPFIIELNGLIIQSDTAISVPYNQPTTPGEKLFLVVSSPDDTNASGLVWTVLTREIDYTAGFVFAVRQDLGGTHPRAVWVQPPTASIRSILSRLERPLQHRSERASAIDGGPFRIDVDNLNANTPLVVRGPATEVIAASLGAYLGFDADGGFVLPPPHHSYPRRDRLVLRRGAPGDDRRISDAMFGGNSADDGIDAERAFARHASVELVPGVPRRTDITAVATAFGQSALVGGGDAATGGGMLAAAVQKNLTPAAGPGTARDGSFTRVTNYNSLFVAYQRLAGTNTLRLLMVDPDRSTVATFTGTTNDLSRTHLDVVPLPDGGAVILYTSTTGAGVHEKLWMSRVDAAGVFTQQGVLVLDADTGTGIVPSIVADGGIKHPKGFLDEDGNIQVVMEIEMDGLAAGPASLGTAEALFWVKMDADGTLLSQPVRLTDYGTGVTPTSVVRDPVVQYANGTVYVTAIRTPDLTAAAPDAIYLEFVNAATTAPTQVALSDATTTSQVDRLNRVLASPGLYKTGTVGSAVVAVDKSGAHPVAVFSGEDGGGLERRYIHYGSPGSPSLARFMKRTDSRDVSAIDMFHHSDQLGGVKPSASEASIDLVMAHDGSAVHLVGWDAANSQLVYERAVPHSLNDRPFAGELTTKFILQTVAGGDAWIADDIVMTMAASGEPLIVRIPAAGAEKGDVILTEVHGVEGEPDPLTPDLTVLAEFDVPAWDGSSTTTDITPTLLSSARATEPARELVVGGGAPGGLVGVAGLQLALETLRGRGGTIRVRSGFYDLFQPVELTSGIEVKCDPGAVFRSSSTASPGALTSAGTTAFVPAVDSAGVATINLPQHPRVIGYTEGCLLRNVSTGDEFYVTEIFEEPGKVRVSDPSMPTGNYDVCQTGIQWSGGTFIGEFGRTLNLDRVAHSSFTGLHVRMGTSGTPEMFGIEGSTDIKIRGWHCDLGTNGQVFPVVNLPNESSRVSIRECKFGGGNTIGTIFNWSDFEFIDIAFTDALIAMVVWHSSGTIDRVRCLSDVHLTLMSSARRVVVGDTGFGFQTDANRTGPFNDTENKPTWTDGWFRGNLYVSGHLNHGQYDLAILSLAMLVLDEQLFQLFGMVDGITEDFQNFDDVLPASTFGRWYPGVSPLVLGAPVAALPEAMVGLSDRVAPDYVLDGATGATEMLEYDNPSAGGLHGRHAAIRGVLHHDAHPAAPGDGQDGFPDRGKIEFQGSWGAAGETEHLVGECGHKVGEPSAPPYTVIQDNVGTSGSDGDELTFSSVRYDHLTPLVVGQIDPAVPGKWQRIYDSYTSMGNDRIAVASSWVYGIGPGEWDLRVRVDLFEASTGVHLGQASLGNGSLGPSFVPCTAMYQDAPSLTASYGEFSEMVFVPDTGDATKLWLFMVGRFQIAGSFNTQAAIRVARVDLGAGPIDPTTLFDDIGGAGIRFNNLDSADMSADPDVYWRGLSVVPVADTFNGSTTDASNYVVACMKTTTIPDVLGQATWALNVGVFNETDEDFSAPGGMVAPSGATVTTAFIPATMTNVVDRAGVPLTLPNDIQLNLISEGASWAWKPLSGGSYISGGAPRAVFILATGDDRLGWDGASLTAIRVSWDAADNWDAPNAANVLAAGATFNLSHFPGAIWDEDGKRFLMAFAEGNAFTGHTDDEVFTHRVGWVAGPWVWDGAATSRRPTSPPRLRNLVSASLADQDDLTADHRLNVAWQSKDGGSDDVWGGIQIDSANNTTLGIWYDADLPEMTEAWPWQLNMARYWMSDGQWTPGAELSAPASTDTLLREHYMLYHQDSGTILQGHVFLRCVAPQLAVKVELDIPWADNLDPMDLRVLGAGQTNDNGAAAVPGYEAFAQTGFRSSNVLSHANAAPTNDDYAGGAPIIAANVDPYLAARDWETSGTIRTGTLAAANISILREIFEITLASNDEKWTVDSRVIALETASGLIGGADVRDIMSLMVGQVVTINDGGVGGPSDHKITYFGNDPSGNFSMVIEPPVGFAPAGPFANNTLTFKKQVTGALICPVDGESTIVHPERIWLNMVDLEAERLPVLIGASVDTTPLVPPGSAVVLLSLIDVDGTLADDIAAGGASLSDYMTVEVTRNYPTAADWQAVTFDTLQAGGPNPIFSAPQGNGSTLYIAYALHSWGIAPVSEKDVSYRITWVNGTFPGKRLHLDKVVLGWN